MSKVVTRFAPSPTGFMHIGGVRTALFAWLYARKNNGTFILRIEDTDKDREVEGSINHIQESLRWLGIEWDFGPDKPGMFGSCIQSQRLEIYRRYAQKLVDKGLAYPDPYTEEEVARFREVATEEKRPFLFRHHRPLVMEKWDGTTPLRFKVPEIKRYEWLDVVRGKLSAGEEMLDDFIIMKADGFPTYNFAHIVDDHEMGVTHVMRGEEFIASTPKFLSLYDALEIPYPIFVTLPPIMGPDGKKKLSKRDGAKDLLEYRSDGYLPEAMCNFLALIGWSAGHDVEILPKDSLIAHFSLERIHRSGGAFNDEKLKWMNKEYLSMMNDVEFSDYVTKFVPEDVRSASTFDKATFSRLIPTIKERIHLGLELTTQWQGGEYDFVFIRPIPALEIIAWKNDNSLADVTPRLTKAIEIIQSADFSSPESIKAALWPYAEEVGKGELLWPLRVALTGREKSPDPFTVAYIIGQMDSQTAQRPSQLSQ